jgi:hypothetical protein
LEFSCSTESSTATSKYRVQYCYIQVQSPALPPKYDCRVRGSKQGREGGRGEEEKGREEEPGRRKEGRVGWKEGVGREGRRGRKS